MAQRCECQDKHQATPFDDFYTSDEERKAQNHAPGECPGSVDVRLYLRDGRPTYLCSMCCGRSDAPIPIPEAKA